MTRNMQSAEQLELVSRNLKKEANDFEKGAEDIEKAAKSRSFWLFSKKWMLIYGSIGIVVVGLLMFLYYKFF